MSYYDFLSSFNLLKFDRFLFIDVANKVFNWKMYPYFVIAHCIGVCLVLREDINDHCFSRKHPLSCWISTMLCIFAGIILTNFLIGDSILNPLTNHNYLIVASIIWYMMFYSPFDSIYYILNFFPIKLFLMGVKEMYRCKSIYEGILLALKLYPNSYIIILILGTIRGVGSLILRNLERSIRGLPPSSSSEILQPSVSTKLSLITATIFMLHKTGIALTQIPTPILFFSVASFMVYFRISIMIWNIRDPFAPLENIFCAVFLGGVWDTIQKAFNNSPYAAKFRSFRQGGTGELGKRNLIGGSAGGARSSLDEQTIDDYTANNAKINKNNNYDNYVDEDEDDPPYQQNGYTADHQFPASNKSAASASYKKRGAGGGGGIFSKSFQVAEESDDVGIGPTKETQRVTSSADRNLRSNKKRD